MSVSIPLAVLMLIVVIALMRSGYVRFGSALACALFGFFLASTNIAPAISAAVRSAAGALTAIPF
ncbi:hypothetical protein [Streptomyces sp. NPDC002573]|uniref:hypothetical protein n=1 Tax=Streptomyces sp. NPDC002573 TaxID=3364651 RepID=UPI00368CF8A2